MSESKAKTRVPLNSPMHGDRNPSYRAQKLRESKFKVPKPVWMAGNSILRRYANGALDFDYAIAKIFECMHNLKNGGPMLPVDQALLAIIMPTLDRVAVPGAAAATMIRLSPEEVVRLQMLTAAEQQEILNWNAGLGGGSTPGRATTLS